MRERKPEEKDLDKLSEASLHKYMAKSAHTAGGLPGPGSIYEHGYQNCYHEHVDVLKQKNANWSELYYYDKELATKIRKFLIDECTRLREALHKAQFGNLNMAQASAVLDIDGRDHPFTLVGFNAREADTVQRGDGAPDPERGKDTDPTHG